MLRFYVKNKVFLNKFINCKFIIMCYFDIKFKIIIYLLYKILDNIVWICLL